MFRLIDFLGLFQFLAIGKGIADFFTNLQVIMMNRIVGNRLQLGYIYFTVFAQYGFIYRNIDNPSCHETGFGIV